MSALKSLPLLSLLLISHCAFALSAADVQKRIDKDIATSNPLVAHLSVALADNKYQWIAKVPDKIGNGQDPKNNLYWGALYGVKTFLTKKSGWKKVEHFSAPPKEILERIVLTKKINRNGKAIPVFLVADAWNGKHIALATQTFFDHASGKISENVPINHAKKRITLRAGGKAHLVSYIGHDLLMDLNFMASNGLTDVIDIDDIKPIISNPHKTSVVLACQSKKYFKSKLQELGTNPLILTNTNMAPEAYSINAILFSFFSKNTPKEIHEATAKAYNKYQKSGIKGARRVFSYQN